MRVSNREKQKIEVMEKLSFRLPHFSLQKRQVQKDNNGRTVVGAERWKGKCMKNWKVVFLQCGKELSERLVRKVERHKSKG